MRLGLDRLSDHLRSRWRGARVGLLCHAASRTSDGNHAIALLADNAAWRLTTLFGPEHGMAGRAQDLERVASGRDPSTGLPVYSLYGDTPASLTPTPAMLTEIDCLVIDLQDIGTRYYTYLWTMALCLQACAAAKKPVLVCDRPNPITGVTIEGPLNAPGFASFVGLYPLPIRHGMTIGEIARYLNEAHHLGARIDVLPMEGWRREWHWDATGLVWTDPSPNMRSLAAALCYPGLCLLEATNVAEGRGTDTPFEICGAPWIDGKTLAAGLRDRQLPGIAVTPTQFTPSARKYAGQSCGGVRLTITDREAFRSYEFGLALLQTLATSNNFRWRDPQGLPPDDGPYEFVVDRPAIDCLTGSSHVRQALAAGARWPMLRLLADPPAPDFLAQRSRYLLY